MVKIISDKKINDQEIIRFPKAYFSKISFVKKISCPLVLYLELYLEVMVEPVSETRAEYCYFAMPGYQRKGSKAAFPSS